MLDLLELEETVGRAWHRLIGATASYPVHAAEAATLAEVQGQIAVMFRALGGEAGVQIARVKARKSGHRLGWRQRIGLCDESSIIQAATGQRFFYPTGSLWFRIASSMRCSSLAGGMVRHGAGGRHRRESGALERSSRATTRASARRYAMLQPNSPASRSAKNCCWC